MEKKEYLSLNLYYYLINIVYVQILSLNLLLQNYIVSL